VTAQLVDTRTQAHIWSDIYDRQLDDIFVVQSEIAEKVASALRLTLLEKGGATRRPTDNVAAYTLYLRGHSYVDKHSKDSILRAIGFYRKAIELDPGFAHAYSMIAYAYIVLGSYELMPPAETLPKAKEAATVALSMDDGLAEAHLAMSRVLRTLNWDYVGAEREARRAIELDPNLSAAHAALVVLLQGLGRKEEALAETEKVLALDPYSVPSCQSAGTSFLYGGRYDEAIEQFQRALELEPNLPVARDNLGLAYIRKGMIEQGMLEIRTSIELEPEDPQTRCDLAYALVKAGDTEGARKILADLLAMRERKSGVAIAIAGVYVSLGEVDKALDWLEKGFEEHAPYMAALRADFVYESLWNEPRFKVLEKRAGLVRV
jgi:tetratricopeptide (TPR) repeat protein